MTPAGGGRLLLGHRGASADHPENTLVALQAALQTAHGFEFDVRLTHDGVAVAFHDDDTLRLTGVAGTIEGRDLREVRELRVRGEPIPTLAEVVALWGRRTTASAPFSMNAELKPTGSAGPLIDACRVHLDPFAAGTSPALVVSSFDPRVLAQAIDTAVPWRLAFLYEDLAALKALPHLTARREIIDLHPYHRFITAEHLAAHQAPGRIFRTWTVDEPAEAERLYALGVAAVISNRPAEMAQALGIGATTP